MILINDGLGITDPEITYKRTKAGCIKLREIIDDDNAAEERRNWALDEFLRYQEELEILNELNGIPFDTLIFVLQENETFEEYIINEK